jgi:hypothetical protein
VAFDVIKKKLPMGDKVHQSVIGNVLIGLEKSKEK